MLNSVGPCCPYFLCCQRVANLPDHYPQVFQFLNTTINAGSSNGGKLLSPFTVGASSLFGQSQSCDIKRIS